MFRRRLFLAPAPQKLFSYFMIFHWYKVNVNKMLTLLKFRPLMLMILCWHFPLATDVSKRFIGRDCLYVHVAAVGNDDFMHCDVTVGSRHVSTSTFFGCFILERLQNPTITDTITVSEHSHVTSALSLFVNTKPVKSCFEKRIRLVKFFTSKGKIIGAETQLNKSI